MVVPTMLARIVDYIETHDIGGIPTLRGTVLRRRQDAHGGHRKGARHDAELRVRQRVRLDRDELDGLHPRPRRPPRRPFGQRSGGTQTTHVGRATAAGDRAFDPRRRRQRSSSRHPRRGLGSRRAGVRRVSRPRLAVQRRRMVPDQRRRLPRRRWLPVPRRARRRHHHPRRREHVAGRDRRRARRPSVGCRRGGDRHPRSAMG